MDSLAAAGAPMAAAGAPLAAAGAPLAAAGAAPPAVPTPAETMVARLTDALHGEFLMSALDGAQIRQLQMEVASLLRQLAAAEAAAHTAQLALAESRAQTAAAERSFAVFVRGPLPRADARSATETSAAQR